MRYSAFALKGRWEERSQSNSAHSKRPKVMHNNSRHFGWFIGQARNWWSESLAARWRREQCILGWGGVGMSAFHCCVWYVCLISFVPFFVSPDFSLIVFLLKCQGCPLVGGIAFLAWSNWESKFIGTARRRLVCENFSSLFPLPIVVLDLCYKE